MRALARVVTVAVLISMFTAGSAAADPKPDFDSRGGAQIPAFSAGEKDAQADLRADLGGKELTGRVSATRSSVSITGLRDQLTDPASGSPEQIALAYLRDNAVALGLRADDIDALKLDSSYQSAGGITHLTWIQHAGGLDAYDNKVGANVGAHGSIVNVWSTAIPDFGTDGKPSLSAGEALGVASRNVDADGAAPRPGSPSGTDQATHFSNGATASLTLFGTPAGTKLAWKVGVAGTQPDDYDVLVDADTGDVLARHDYTDYANAATVYERYPGAPLGGTNKTVDLSPWLAAAATTLTGPNTHTFADPNDTCFFSNGVLTASCTTPLAGNEIPPAAGDWFYPITTFPITNTGGLCGAGAAGCSCPPVSPRCTWDQTMTNSSWNTNREQNATQVFYYVNEYHDHLAAAPINFDASNRNFETADPVIANTIDGADTAGGGVHRPEPGHRDNANFSTRPDGTPGLMQMYLFRGEDTVTTPSPTFNTVNGGDDAMIVYHELTHGLSNRLVGNASGLSTFQAQAMGEAWSDWYAFDYLVGQSPSVQIDTATNGELNADEYVSATGNHIIRTEALDCAVGASAAVCPGSTTGAGTGGYTFGDMGKVIDQREVHADGEIWGQTLWDLRTAVGSPVAERIVTDGMRLTPNAPSFLDARDAILAADLADFGGAHINQLWTVFAGRGMGASAVDPSSDATGVTEAFDPPSVVSVAGTSVSDPAPGGDGDGRAEPGETVSLTTTVRNPGPSAVSGLGGTLSSGTATAAGTSVFTPDVLVKGATATNATPFTVTIPQTTSCGGSMPLTLSPTSTEGNGSTNFSLPVGGVGSAVDQAKDEGLPGVPFFDRTGAPATSAITRGDGGTVGDVNVTLDMLPNNADGDMDLRLISPSGTVVRLAERPGGEGNAVDDFTGTVLDDDSSGPIIGARPVAVGNASPYTGTFKPMEPLSRFDDEPIAGTWTLRARDIGSTDHIDVNPSTTATGHIQKWTLSITPRDCTTTPTAATADADGIAQSTATLHGNVDPRGTSTQYRFEYGTTDAYGATTDATEASGAAAAAIGGLSPSTTYHYRVVALRAGAVVVGGGDKTFATAPKPQTVAPPPPPPPLVAGFSFTTSPKTLTLDSKGQFTWTFTARAGLTGKAVFKTAGKIVLKKGAKKAIVTVGSKSFTVDANGVAKIKVKVPKAFLTFIKKHPTQKLTIALSSTNPVAKANSKLTLKAPKKKK